MTGARLRRRARGLALLARRARLRSAGTARACRAAADAAGRASAAAEALRRAASTERAACAGDAGVGAAHLAAYVAQTAEREAALRRDAETHEGEAARLGVALRHDLAEARGHGAAADRLWRADARARAAVAAAEDLDRMLRGSAP
ncbi:hypothetical protein JQC91_05190 [Jannaschia sp. Os4]|uniref:hypothetical protein n=1 Tax=Jannaschia sp. Os4 TaxID=2807617 RepID=UPI0019392D4C|nr:hypothetical protein [Jannaschia sp. Os4]MBM2575694.1 hypothetical protein [Jannaschia sp. Os4]